MASDYAKWCAQWRLPGAGLHPGPSSPVSRDTSNSTIPATIAPGVYARGLGSKVDVPPRQRSPSPRTRRRRGGCESALTPIQVCDGPEKRGLRPSLRIPAAAALDRRPEARAAACAACRRILVPSRHSAADPDRGTRQCWAFLGAARRTYRHGMHHSQAGARSTRRPQSVAIPRLRHLGRPRMRGGASVRSPKRTDSQRHVFRLSTHSSEPADLSACMPACPPLASGA
jgi:hypothetical protein